MRAVCISRVGGPEVLEFRDVADPRPEGHEVEVRIEATALNRADLLQRRGRYPAPPGSPADIPGLEFVGSVERLGPRCRRRSVGDRVYGIVGGGAHAERLVVDERACARVPERLASLDAAGVPEAFLTALDALERLAVLPGGVVLVHGASTAVGLAAVQIARALGHRVLATSRDAARRERIGRLGALRALDPTATGWIDAVRSASDGGVDGIVDFVTGPDAAATYTAARVGGRVIVLGLLGGARAELDFGALLARRLTVEGSVLRARGLRERIALAERLERPLGRWLTDGTVRPVIDSVRDWTEIAEAHRRMEAGDHFGKLVLTVGRS